MKLLLDTAFELAGEVEATRGRDGAVALILPTFDSPTPADSRSTPTGSDRSVA